MMYINKADFIMTHIFSTNRNLQQRNVLYSVFINHQELEVKIKLNNLTNGIK